MSAHFRLIYEELTAKRLKIILYDSFSHTWDVGANPNGRLFAPKTGHVLRHHFAGYRSLKFGSLISFSGFLGLIRPLMRRILRFSRYFFRSSGVRLETL